MKTQELLRHAKAACPQLAWLGSEEKNQAILRMANAIEANADMILAANAEDLRAAQGVISDVMLDRLRLTRSRIAAMADGMRQVAKLPDPVGEILAEVTRPNGLVIRKTAVPMGVVAIIYESRPNVTSDAAVLALKSGNVCVLRGGKEAYRSAAAIVAAMHEGLRAADLPEAFVNLVSDTTRQSAHELMTANGLVDLLIPRGGAGLIRACVESATVPCIETGTGICHVYVDKAADLEKALNIIENAKTSRPSVCNAEEVVIVHADIAGQFLPMLKKRLVDDRAAAGLPLVELRLDEAAQKLIPGTPAGERDFDTEFLDYILAVKTVSSADEAIAHNCRQLERTSDPDMRCALYHKAVELYKGHLLPRIEHEIWHMQLDMYYQTLYLTITKGYARYKLERKNYTDALREIKNAMQLAPGDSELSMLAVLAAWYQGGRVLARRYYEAVKKYLDGDQIIQIRTQLGF